MATSPMPNLSSDSNPAFKPSPSTTIGELRKHFGPHFAAGYGDSDPLRMLLGNAGVSTLDEYLARRPRS